MNRKKTRLYIIVTLLIFFVLFLFLFPFNTKDENIEFFEKITNIKFPSTFDIEYSFDNGEYISIVAFTGKSEELTAFARQNHLDSADQYNSSSTIGFGQGLFGKFAPPDSFFTKSYFISGHKGKNDWHVLVNPLSGKGWIETTYPDWGGD